MGAVDELHPHQGVLGAENVGVDLIQGVPAQIVVAVAGGAGEVGLRHPVFLEGRQHLAGVLLRNGVDAAELLGQLRLGLGSQGQNFVAYL